MVKTARPIGIFDSGIGGLSVAAAIRELDQFIRERAGALADFLVDRGARAIVIACNTATAAAAARLRERLAIPVVGMEPAVKPAAAATRSGIVGVLATAGTIASARFAGLLDRFGEGVEVLTEPCPDLVDLVERGVLTGDDAQLVSAGADTLILGCTHFPFLRSLIQQEAGAEVRIIDTGAAVARELQRRLPADESAAQEEAGIELFTSGDPERFSRIARRLWIDAPDAGPLD
jgi:glutamate racemase